MTLEIHSDIEYKYFEVVTKDQRFAQYPLAFLGGIGNQTVCTYIDKKNWYKDLEKIASFVNNELNDECIFTLG